jgi:hypothetical protein
MNFIQTEHLRVPSCNAIPPLVSVILVISLFPTYRGQSVESQRENDAAFAVKVAEFHSVQISNAQPTSVGKVYESKLILTIRVKRKLD